MKNEQRSEETRTGILQAAQQLFTNKGYDSTGVAAICRRAGVSKGAFYHHFESKQAVYLALAESWLADLNASLADTLEMSDAPDTQLLDMAHRLHRVLGAQSSKLGLLLDFWAQANRDPHVRAVVVAPYRSFRDRFAELIQDGIDRKRFRPVDAQAAAQVILSLASGLFFQGLLDPHDVDWGQVAETSIKILIDGLSENPERLAEEAAEHE